VTTYPPEVTVCDGVLGCVMLIDGDLVRALAPQVFCGELFICADESELSLRARRGGVRTLYIPTTIGYHKSGVSTSRVSRMANYYSARNWAFLRLHYSPGLVRKLLILASIGTYSGLRLIQFRPLFLFGSIAGLFMYISHWLDSRVLGHSAPKPLYGEHR
jgi:GT2 family glycosyltransferase